VGYGIVSSHQRRGYATETVRGCSDRAFALPQVRRAIAETLPALTPSIGVLRQVRVPLIGEGPSPASFASS
jgi:RimJ/RimL family protein N-acetyltransferase